MSIRAAARVAVRRGIGPSPVGHRSVGAEIWAFYATKVLVNAAAAIVTGFVVAATVFVGPRAAGLSGVGGVLIAAVVLIKMA